MLSVGRLLAVWIIVKRRSRRLWRRSLLLLRAAMGQATILWMIVWMCSSPTIALAQSASTVATGDTRTVTLPVLPPVCAQVAATKYVVSTTTLNLDPYNATASTPGVLGSTGGTSFEPSSTASPTFTSSETLDNTAVQNALNSCPAGQAVELIAGGSGKQGFVLGPWSLPSGVSVIGDFGIHVYMSRNLSDFGGTNCGLLTNGSSNCSHWITAGSTTGSGIYGNFVLDGRGWDKYTTSSTQSFYVNRLQAYGNKRGGAFHGSPALTPNAAGILSNGPNMFNLIGANNFTIFQTTLKDCAQFCVNYKNANGGTFWGVRIFTPFELSNTDGIDPLNSTNVSILNSVISNGDNQVSIKSDTAGLPAMNITVCNNQTGAGIGLVIGSATLGGVSNILFCSNIHNGNLFNDQSEGNQIGSSGANGGLVNIVSFLNDCMMNEAKSYRFYTNYNGDTGTHTPIYHNILVQNATVLASTAPYTTGNSGTFTLQGLNGNPITIQYDNFSIQGLNQGIESQNGVDHDQYATVYRGPRQVPSSIVTQLTPPPTGSAGPGVTLGGTAGTSTPYPCSTSMWHPLTGALNIKSAVANNNQIYVGSTAFTLQAMLEPATAINTKESPALTAAVQFLDNGTSIGSSALSGDGTYAEFAVSTPPSGAHTYTAYYPGDAHYAPFTFGSVALINGGAIVTLKGSVSAAGTIVVR